MKPKIIVCDVRIAEDNKTIKKGYEYFYDVRKIKSKSCLKLSSSDTYSYTIEIEGRDDFATITFSSKDENKLDIFIDNLLEDIDEVIRSDSLSITLEGYDIDKELEPGKTFCYKSASSSGCKCK